MPLSVSFCVDEDSARLFEIISLAFGHEHAYVEALWPNHDTPAGREAGAERLLFAKQNQPWAKFLKVVDTNEDTGKEEIAGFMKWDVYAQEDGSGIVPEVPVHMPEQYYENQDANDYADYIWNEFTRRRWDAVRKTGGRIVSLDIAAVDPKYQRRGVGKMLMQYGVDVADKLGVESVVEASRRGRFLYQNFGFTILEDVTITNPPKQKGQQEQFIYWMHRPAKASTKTVDSTAP